MTNPDEGKPCPECGDTMTMAHDNYLPTWSDHHDNIVCWWCAKHSEAAGPQISG